MPATHILIFDLYRDGDGYDSLLSYLQQSGVNFEEKITTDENSYIDISIEKAEQFVPIMMKIGHALWAPDYEKIVIF